MKSSGKNPGGRPSEEFRIWCRAIVEDRKVQAGIKKLMTEPTHRNFPIVLHVLLKYGYGQPVQQVEHSGTIGIEQIGQAREAFDSRMARLTARLGAATMPEFPER